MNSTVLIKRFTGANTEIAKNLALTAINIVLDDPREITLERVQSNFLFSHASEYQPGQRFDSEGAKILRDMNPFIKIGISSELGQQTDKSSGSSQDWCLEVSPMDLSSCLGLSTSGSAIRDESEEKSQLWRPKLCSISICYRFLAYFQSSESMPNVQKACQMVVDGTWDAPDLRDLFLSLKNPSVAGLLGENVSELCPVYSVGGSILSQEVVSFIKDPVKATQGWIYYDALGGSARIFPYKPSGSAVQQPK